MKIEQCTKIYEWILTPCGVVCYTTMNNYEITWRYENIQMLNAHIQNIKYQISNRVYDKWNVVNIGTIILEQVGILIDYNKNE